MYKNSTLEVIGIMIKMYYSSLKELPEMYPTNLLIKINDLEQEFWMRTGKHYREVYGECYV